MPSTITKTNVIMTIASGLSNHDSSKPETLSLADIGCAQLLAQSSAGEPGEFPEIKSRELADTFASRFGFRLNEDVEHLVCELVTVHTRIESQ